MADDMGIPTMRSRFPTAVALVCASALLGAVSVARADSGIIEGTRMGDHLVGSGTSETIYGRSGHDRLFGRGASDALWGGDGNDRISGGGGADWIRGGHGNDRISGDSGDDRLFGDLGDDVIRGGPGSDRLSGGAGDDDLRDRSAGFDVLNGGSRLDTIDSVGGGMDRVDCGIADDRARVDRDDIVAESCETVERIDERVLGPELRVVTRTGRLLGTTRWHPILPNDAVPRVVGDLTLLTVVGGRVHLAFSGSVPAPHGREIMSCVSLAGGDARCVSRAVAARSGFRAHRRLARGSGPRSRLWFIRVPSGATQVHALGRTFAAPGGFAIFRGPPALGPVSAVGPDGEVAIP